MSRAGERGLGLEASGCLGMGLGGQAGLFSPGLAGGSAPRAAH